MSDGAPTTGARDGAAARLERALVEAGASRPVIDRILAATDGWLALEAEYAVHELARRLVDHERQLAEADHRYRRFSQRRSVRAVTALVDALRGEGIAGLRGLRERVDVGDPVPSDRALLEAVRPPSGPLERERPRYLRPAARERRSRYPHLLVGHVGTTRTFGSVADHVTLPGQPWQRELGYDLILLEPVGGELPLESDELDRIVEESRRTEGVADLPVVLVARTEADLGAPGATQAEVVITGSPAVGAAFDDRSLDARLVALEPSVDATVFNPIGWQLEPELGVLAVIEDTERAGDAAALHTLVEPCGDELQVRLAGAAEPALLPEPLRTTLNGRVESDSALREILPNYRAVIADPAWHASETAYVTHVLRALATGTPVITTGSARLSDLVAGPALHRTAGPGDTTRAISDLADAETREHRSIVTRREVLQRHTRTARFETLLAALDVPVRGPETVSIVLSTKRPHLLRHAVANVARQTYPEKELVLVLHGDGFDHDHVEALAADQPFPVRVVSAGDDRTFGDCLNAGIAATTGALVAKMDDDDVYGPAFLTDLVLALDYSGAGVVGKYAAFAYLRPSDVTVRRGRDLAERYRKKVSGATMLMRREVAEGIGFLRRDSRVDATFARRVERLGGTLYVTHSHDFIFCRHGSGHTWSPGRQHLEEDETARHPGLATEVAFTVLAEDEVVRWPAEGEPDGDASVGGSGPTTHTHEENGAR